MAEIEVAWSDLHEFGQSRDRKSTALVRLPRAIIELSEVAPRLSELATKRRTDAEQQAARVREINAFAAEISTALRGTVGMLHGAAREIGGLTESIRRIAEETSLIAVNAGIAAGRAGDEGRVFAVLAREIRTLAQKAADAAASVDDNLRRLSASAERTADVIGIDEAGGRAAGAHGLAALLAHMANAGEAASRQADEAVSLAAMGEQLRHLADDMIRSVGAFRLEAHRRAEALVEELREDPGMVSAHLDRIAHALHCAVDRSRFVQLAYVTDMHGVQVIGNVSRGRFIARYGENGAGRDWSSRPWFRGALRTDGVYSSEIYRSEATGDYCLTVAATFPNDGRPIGVVALDVDLRELLGGIGRD